MGVLFGHHVEYEILKIERVQKYLTQQYNTIKYNFIDLRRRNSPLVRLQDKDAIERCACICLMRTGLSCLTCVV